MRSFDDNATYIQCSSDIDKLTEIVRRTQKHASSITCKRFLWHKVTDACLSACSELDGLNMEHSTVFRLWRDTGRTLHVRCISETDYIGTYRTT